MPVDMERIHREARERTEKKAEILAAKQALEKVDRIIINQHSAIVEKSGDTVGTYFAKSDYHIKNLDVVIEDYLKNKKLKVVIKSVSRDDKLEATIKVAITVGNHTTPCNYYIKNGDRLIFSLEYDDTLPEKPKGIWVTLS